jgi:hypothetical protein
VSAEKLEAALRVVRAAEAIFYVEGDDNGVEALLSEALRSAAQEFKALGTRLYGAEAVPDWQGPWRACRRVELALELAAFMRKFGPVPAAETSSDSDGGAS